MQKLRNNRKENNLCVSCGVTNDREGYYCVNCNDKYNTWKRAHKMKYHQEGRCVTCGNVLDRVGWFCIKCTSNLKLRARIRSEERRLNSLCVQCGVKVDSGSYCRRCLDMRMDKYWKKKASI